MSDGMICVRWQCGMGSSCTNQENPGLHDEYEEAGICCGAIPQIDKEKR